MGMKPPGGMKNARRAQNVNNSGGGDDCKDSSNGGGEVKQEGDESSGNGEANSFSKELARLQFFGAGPKMAGLPSDKETTRGMKLNFKYDPVSQFLFPLLV